jgi:hypothetical protein
MNQRIGSCQTNLILTQHYYPTILGERGPVGPLLFWEIITAALFHHWIPSRIKRLGESNAEARSIIQRHYITPKGERGSVCKILM